VTRRVPILPTLAAIGLALVVAAAAFASWPTDAGSGGPRLELSSSQFRFGQSAAGRALVDLSNAKPGQVAGATTRLTLTGARATVSLRAVNRRDFAGPSGGKLITSGRLWIMVRCLSPACAASDMAYRGPLSEMRNLSLGTWRRGAQRTYSVRVWLLRSRKWSTTDDNVFQGSRARFGLIWTATQISG
jgi:hypothetical protein